MMFFTSTFYFKKGFQKRELLREILPIIGKLFGHRWCKFGGFRGVWLPEMGGVWGCASSGPGT